MLNREWHPRFSTYSCRSSDSFQLTLTESVVKNNFDLSLISWTAFNESRKLIEIELIVRINVIRYLLVLQY